MGLEKVKNHLTVAFVEFRPHIIDTPRAGAHGGAGSPGLGQLPGETRLNAARPGTHSCEILDPGNK